MNVIHETVRRYFEIFPEERARLFLLQEQCKAGEDVKSRKNFRGHVTGSGIVVYEGKVLLIFHTFLQMYLQPGGHYEGDMDMMACAMREVEEETGLTTKAHPWHEKNDHLPLLINTHSIPENANKKEAAHYHHDHFYLLLAKDITTLALEKEAIDGCEWRSLEDLEKSDNEGLRKCAQKIHTMKLL